MNDLLGKVVCGLESCTRGNGICQGVHCPYHKDRDETIFCRMDLVSDICSLLQIDANAPRVLTLEEIEQAPDYSLLYEEVRIDWSVCAVEEFREDKVETSIAPMEKRGGTLYGSGMNTDICPDMFVGEPGSECQVRYWLGRPTDQQREATPWKV